VFDWDAQEDDEKPLATIVLKGAVLKRFGWEDYGKTFCFGVMERDGSIEDEKSSASPSSSSSTEHWLDAAPSTNGPWQIAEKAGRAWIMTTESARQRDDWLRALAQYENEDDETPTPSSSSTPITAPTLIKSSSTPGAAASSTSPTAVAPKPSSSSSSSSCGRPVAKGVPNRAVPWDLMACVDRIYYPVLRELLADPLELPLRICHNLHSSSFDKVAKSLLSLAELSGRTLDLFQACIAREVELTGIIPLSLLIPLLLSYLFDN
jgi:hypothetical protein